MYFSVLKQASGDSAQYEWVTRRCARVDPDRLGVEICLDRGDAVSPAKSGVLEAAEGRKEAHRAVGVPPDRPGADALAHAERPADVGGPHAGAETVPAVVGDRDRFLLVAERDHREHRAEHLLLRNA